MKAAKVKNFHVPLPDETYSELRDVAQGLNRPATQVARDLIQEWLRQRRKAALRQELAAYVSSQAGTSADLDPELEAAGVEHLLRAEEPISVRKKRR